MKILVTGAGGFVGRHFLEQSKAFTMGTLDLRKTDWQQESMSGYDVIVHLAGKAHDMQQTGGAVYYEVNTELTRALYEKASREGVGHFIYISSTKVYGDAVTEILNENSPRHPDDDYGKSKMQAEDFLLTQKGNCLVAVLRPPLVYGPGVKGNMISLLRLCSRSWPLPFLDTGNRRSMVYVNNLVALLHAIIRQKASGIFLAGDDRSLSTGELVSAIRTAMGRKPGLFSLPGFMRGLIKKLKPRLYIRLYGSYELDTSDTNRRLSFLPPHTAEEGIAAMVKWYQENK